MAAGPEPTATSINNWPVHDNRLEIVTPASTVTLAGLTVHGRQWVSGLHRPAWALAVYASPGGIPAPDERLASGCWLANENPLKSFHFLRIRRLCGIVISMCRLHSEMISHTK